MRHTESLHTASHSVAASPSAVLDTGVAHHVERDGRPAPRWAVVAAHVVALLNVPSSLWRIALALGFSLGMLHEGAPVHVSGWESVYVVGLSVVAESAAFLTLGLVRPWGERLPAWLPFVGGRRLSPRAVIAPAALGAVLLAGIWAFAFRNFPDLEGIAYSHEGWKLLLVVCYLPLLLWAPLLAAVTHAYYRRRCRD